MALQGKTRDERPPGGCQGPARTPHLQADLAECFLPVKSDSLAARSLIILSVSASVTANKRTDFRGLGGFVSLCWRGGELHKQWQRASGARSCERNKNKQSSPPSLTVVRWREDSEDHSQYTELCIRSIKAITHTAGQEEEETPGGLPTLIGAFGHSPPAHGDALGGRSL